VVFGGRTQLSDCDSQNGRDDESYHALGEVNVVMLLQSGSEHENCAVMLENERDENSAVMMENERVLVATMVAMAQRTTSVHEVKYEECAYYFEHEEMWVVLL